MVGSHLISSPMIPTSSIPAAGTLHERVLQLVLAPTLSILLVFSHPTDSPLIIFCPHLSFYLQMCTLTKTSATAAAKSLQLCLTLWDLIDCSPPGSSLPGILQARTLEWVTISFSNACMHAKLLQLCPTLWDPMDSSPPDSSVHGILWARILEWVAISFSTLRPLPPPNSGHLNVYIHTAMLFSFDLCSLGSFHHSNLTKNIASLKSCLCIQAEVLTLIKEIS